MEKEVLVKQIQQKAKELHILLKEAEKQGLEVKLDSASGNVGPEKYYFILEVKESRTLVKVEI